MNGAGHPERDPIASAVDLLKRDVGVRPGLVERTRRRRVRQRRWRGAKVGALSLALALLLLARDGGRPGRVTFAVELPAGSDSVSLVGDFTDWEEDRIRLKRGRGNRWEVTVDLPPGHYRFAYVTASGQWLADPGAAPALDAFGRPTSTILVAE